MVASGNGLPRQCRNLGRTTELSHHDYHCLVEQSGCTQVIHQSRQALIELREQRVFELAPVVDVRVPCLHDAHGRLHERHAGLDHSPRQQQ